MIVSLLTAVAIYFIRYFTNYDLPLICYNGIFPTWLVFFIYGLYLGTTKKALLSNKWLIPLILIFYSLSCLESYYLYSQFHQAGSAASTVKLSAFLYSFLIITLLFNNVGRVNSKVLKILGEASFGIFLIHMFVLLFLKKSLTLLPTLEKIQPLYQLTLFIMAMLLCLLFISVGQKIFSNKHAKFIGL